MQSFQWLTLSAFPITDLLSSADSVSKPWTSYCRQLLCQVSSTQSQEGARLGQRNLTCQICYGTEGARLGCTIQEPDLIFIR